jgi:phage-related holin
MLFLVTVLDFITGVIASYVEDKKVQRVYSAYFLQSNKLRKSAVKTMSYMVLILVSHFFALVFGLKNITIPIIDIHTELSTIAFVVCISIETFSIFENLKRSGFDIAKEIKKVVSGLLSIVKYFQNTKTKIGKL